MSGKHTYRYYSYHHTCIDEDDKVKIKNLILTCGRNSPEDPDSLSDSVGRLGQKVDRGRTVVIGLWGMTYITFFPTFCVFSSITSQK